MPYKIKGMLSSSYPTFHQSSYPSRRQVQLAAHLLIIAALLAAWLPAAGNQSAPSLPFERRSYPASPAFSGRVKTPPPAGEKSMLVYGEQISGTLSAPANWVYLPLTLLAVQEVDFSSEGTYYVATGGSDSSGNGSSSRPWKTIGHAVNEVPDGAQILVRPGTYSGKTDLDRRFSQGITIRSEKPYQAKLRNSHDKVVSVCTGAGITLTGFDIAHASEADGRYVIQIQDCRDDGSTQRIVLRDNIIHDSYYDDLIKVNNGAQKITIEGNMFYNMGGPETDNHIDVNSVYDVTIQDNIFFNDFSDSGRTNRNNTGHFIVIKDSNGNDDGIQGSHDITVRRNVFLNWQGEEGSAYIGLGDGRDFSYYQAQDILIENNLFLGNSGNKIHTPLKVSGAKNVTFRCNTIQGNLPSGAYAMRLEKSGSGLKNVNIRFYNNIWSDPQGTMGEDSGGDYQRFSNTPRTDTQSYSINSNLYWNNGRTIPSNSNDLINYSNDGRRVTGDPKITRDQSEIIPPCWDSGKQLFDDGSSTIRQAFTTLVNRYGKIASDSKARDAANGSYAPSDDILGNARNQGPPDIGAYEWRP